MAINLKAPKKVDLKLQNPISSLQNPVEDFLAPMKQTKSDLEQKIAQISAGNNNPNTIIPEMKYNPSTQFTDFGNQATGAGLTTEQPSIQTTAPREFGVAPGFEGQADITKSIPYQALAPMEGFLQGAQEVTKDFSQNLQDVGQKISEVSTQMGDTIQNKSVGLAEAKSQGKYLTQDQVKDFLDQNKNMTDDQLVTAMSDLEKEGFFFEGYNDLNSEGQSEQGTYVGSLREGAGSIVKGVGGMFGMGAEALGGTMEGVQNIAEGQTGLGASQVVAQVPNVAMTAFNAVAPGAGAITSSAFSTDEGQTVMEPVSNISTDISKSALDLTNLDPNSEEYQNYLKGLSGTLPLVATAGVAGGVKKFSPEIKTGFNKTGEFIKENAPIVGETVKNVGVNLRKATEFAGEKISNVKGNMKDMATETISSIPKNERVGMQGNPYQMDDFSKMVERSKSGEGIDDIKNYKTEKYEEIGKQAEKVLTDMRKQKSEDAEVYNDIKSLNTPVPVAPIIDSFTKTLGSNGMEIQNGKVVRKTGIEAGEINQADVAKFNQLYQDIVATGERQNGTITPAQTIQLRKTASSIAGYDATTTSKGQSVMRSVRSGIDKVAKDTIPGLRELDANFVDQLNRIEEGVRDLVYKGGDMKGDFRSNLGSIISNLANPSRAKLLGRLEEILPGIGKKVESINNLSRLYKAMNDKGIFQKYSGAGGAGAGFVFGGTVFPVIGNILGAVAGGITGLLIDGAVTKGKLSVLENILKKETPQKRAEIGRIVDAIKKNKKLDEASKKIVDDIKQKVTDAKVEEIITEKPGPLKLGPGTEKTTGKKNFNVGKRSVEKPPLESTKKAVIKDPRVKAMNDYLDLKSLEESLTKGDEYTKSQARKAFNRKIEQVKTDMANHIYEKVMSKEMKKYMIEYTSSPYPEGMQTIFNKLKGYTKNKGNYNDIEGEAGATGLKREFADYVTEYNHRTGNDFTVNEMWDKFDDKFRVEPVKEQKQAIKKGINIGKNVK